ncbi:uncharacterized protein EI97DRAFT_82728 [Westerdykella ornata]|uniref:Uncharacterized protein n=1 Tax=Westerdykella ornata TaxID=318751 RepID=A0A6A6JGF7_WESOR|nr:uncharacterized protein EI97DRAFT_82728 [Westerdykella ornata]KAF2275294.1 hypothetical protein EI97DRAFT_82728 [Westerdykella ornata]
MGENKASSLDAFPAVPVNKIVGIVAVHQAREANSACLVRGSCLAAGTAWLTQSSLMLLYGLGEFGAKCSVVWRWLRGGNPEMWLCTVLLAKRTFTCRRHRRNQPPWTRPNFIARWRWGIIEGEQLRSNFSDYLQGALIARESITPSREYVEFSQPLGTHRPPHTPGNLMPISISEQVT